MNPNHCAEKALPTAADVRRENDIHEIEQRLARALAAGQTAVIFQCQEVLRELRGENGSNQGRGALRARK